LSAHRPFSRLDAARHLRVVAQAACSCCATASGAFQKAKIASPMNLSTVPSSWMIKDASSSKYVAAKQDIGDRSDFTFGEDGSPRGKHPAAQVFPYHLNGRL
jgi:hypothetical protein